MRNPKPTDDDDGPVEDEVKKLAHEKWMKHLDSRVKKVKEAFATLEAKRYEIALADESKPADAMHCAEQSSIKKT